MSSCDSKLKRILTNMKKIKLPWSKADSILRGFSGAGDLREEYAEMIKPTGPTTLALKNDMSNWNAHTNSRVRADEKNGIVISFPKGGFASRGGVNLKCVPDGLERTTHAIVEYEVYIPKGFDFVKGGKLGVGMNINNGAGGKSWKKNDASYRLMWRAGGQCIAYLYLATDQGSYTPGKTNSPLLMNQGKNFMEAIANKAPSAGLDVFRYTKKKMYLKTGQWNRIRMVAKLNDKDKNNGVLELSVNGDTMSVDDMMWTANTTDNMFSQLQMANWFGGGDASWGAKKNESITIRNVKYTFD